MAFALLLSMVARASLSFAPLAEVRTLFHSAFDICPVHTHGNVSVLCSFNFRFIWASCWSPQHSMISLFYIIIYKLVQFNCHQTYCPFYFLNQVQIEFFDYISTSIYLCLRIVFYLLILHFWIIQTDCFWPFYSLFELEIIFTFHQFASTFSNSFSFILQRQKRWLFQVYYFFWLFYV